MDTGKKKKKPELILFDGVSGAGKSMFLEFIKKNSINEIFIGKKFTNRQKRESDNNWEFQFVDKISTSNHLLFNSVGNQYGINLSEIEQKICEGFSYVISCTDKNVIHNLKSRFNVIVIYIYRNFTFSEFSNTILKKDPTGKTTMDERLQEFNQIASDYLENINIYDHVVLNIDSDENAIKQLISILSSYGFTLKI